MSSSASHTPAENMSRRDTSPVIDLNPGKRCVLMVACAFPPTGGPGVQRSAKFAKFLPRHGWIPIVWAADPIPGLPLDGSLLVDLPAAVQVYRTRQAGLFHRLMPRPQAFPDAYAGWAKRSLRPLRRLIEELPVNVIYSTYSPASNHWIGLELKRRTGAPWVADFRDLWTDEYRYSERRPSRRAADRRLEDAILAEADAVIGATDSMTSSLRDRVPGQYEKFHTITNGYDPDDFAVAEAGDAGGTPLTDASSPDAVLRLAHVGRFDRWRTNEALLCGLGRFVHGLADRRRFLLDIVGHLSPAVRRRLRTDAVPFAETGYVSHRRAIHHMRTADVLLLTCPEGPRARSVVPAKLYEYVAAERPILAMAERPSETAAMVDRFHAGWVVPFEAAAVVHRLQSAYACRQSGRRFPLHRTGSTEPISRPRLAEQLSSILNRCSVPCGGNAVCGGPSSSRHGAVESTG